MIPETNIYFCASKSGKGEKEVKDGASFFGQLALFQLNSEDGADVAPKSAVSPPEKDLAFRSEVLAPSS